MNYFDLFGFPRAPLIDRAVLAKKYFELQKASHPDFFSQASEEEKETALERSAAVNKGFNIFQNDERTIEYFLQTMDIIQPGEKFNLPPDFLMEMMEINEALSSGEEKEVVKQVGAHEKLLWEEVKNFVENYDPKPGNEEELQRLKAYYYKKKYLKRILDRLGD